MKIFKLSFILIAMIVMLLVGGTAFAFHAGGVADCMGCHIMHDAKGASLTTGSDPSSTCLNCHGQGTTLSGYHVFTPNVPQVGGVPAQMTPGGDFAWTVVNMATSVNSKDHIDKTLIIGDRHGHNVVASDYGLSADVKNTMAPGNGQVNGANLGCTSCHDQHGKGRWTASGYSKTGGAIYTSGSYGAVPQVGVLGDQLATGVYRLLRGTGDVVGGATFNVAPPVAVSPSTYNRAETTTQTRVAYGSGMSEWCATCHPDMHNSGILTHKAGAPLGGTVMGNYNAYIASGNMTGDSTKSYLSLVPFEEGLLYSAATQTTLAAHASNTDAYLNGPTTGLEQVMCLSCHRAHASGFSNMLRWQTEEPFVVSNGVFPGTDNSEASISGGATSAQVTAALYGRTPSGMKMASYNRSLCNKCHAKD